MEKNKPIKRNVLKYTALFEPQTEGGYTVTIPSLPGCISQGDTFEKAVENIKEAITLFLEGVKESDLEDMYYPSEIFTAPIDIFLRNDKNETAHYIRTRNTKNS